MSASRHLVARTRTGPAVGNSFAASPARSHVLPPGELAATRDLARLAGDCLLFAGLLLGGAAVPLVFAPDIYDAFTLPKQALLVIAAAITLTGVCLAERPRRVPRAVTWVVAAWTAALLLSWLTGLDLRHAVLGQYQYRQGLLTQLAYVALFIGALHAPPASLRRLSLAGFGVLLVVALYALVQATGHDPFSWWTDTATRPFSTTGNANELAALILLCCAFAAPWVGRPGWRARTVVFAAFALAGFVLLISESRSGLIALAIVLVAFAALAPAWGWRRRALAGAAMVMVAGLVVGMAASALTGHAEAAVGRVEQGAQRSDPGGSTRVQLWKGTLSVIEAAPLLGSGPDSLPMAFARYRPTGLHGAFDDYDMTVQSSHNVLLDYAANYGLLGLGAIAALVGVCVAAIWRGRRGQSRGDVLVLAALAGYLAICLVNPLSLSAQPLAFVLLGLLLARNFEQRTSPRPVRRLALAGAGVSGALVVAALLLGGFALAADSEAQTAWDRYASGQFTASADEARDAYRLMPLESAYLRRELAASLAAGVFSGPGPLQRAIRTYSDIAAGFASQATDELGLATAQIGLHAPTTVILATIQRAQDLSPESIAARTYLPTLRQAALRGGDLAYSWRDRWVYVRPVTIDAPVP